MKKHSKFIMVVLSEGLYKVSKSEVNKAFSECQGKWWLDKGGTDDYYAVSPSGQCREFYVWATGENSERVRLIKLCAKLWAAGHIKTAEKLEKLVRGGYSYEDLVIQELSGIIENTEAMVLKRWRSIDKEAKKHNIKLFPKAKK